MTITRSESAAPDDPRDDGEGRDDPVVRAIDEFREIVAGEPPQGRRPG
jgi:hypothetical protein